MLIQTLKMGTRIKGVVGNFTNNSDNELEIIASRLRKGVTSDLEVYNVSRYFRENNIPERKNNLNTRLTPFCT